MPLTRPLKPEEVPEQYRESIDYLGQYQQSYTYAGRTKMRSMVFVRCPVCKEYKGTPTNDVRNFIRGIRKVFPDTHRKCKYSGETISSGGYTWTWAPNHPKSYQGKYVPKHILVMEDYLGRYLNTEIESVHHIDGNKANNDITNLQLRLKYHGKGQAWECLDCGGFNIAAVALK